MSYLNKMNCLKCRLVIACMLLCLAGTSQYNFNEADKLLSTNTKTLGNEFAMVVYKDGKIIYQKEVGEFTLKAKAPVEGASQWLTAAMVMLMVEEGKISLDDKVSSYLPIFEQYGKAYITIRQCLSHQTGIADNQKSITKILERKKFESLEEEVNSYAKKEIATNPGTTFFYSNMGANIAGRVLEVVSKKRFDLLIKQRLFTPLNMRNSSFTPEDYTVSPATGATTTAADYINFLAMLQGNGMFAGKRILSEASIAAMQTIQADKVPKKFIPASTEGFGYALGAWITNPEAAINNQVITSVSLTGTLPFIDNCRKYACILLLKKQLKEPSGNFYLQLKKAIDGQLPGTCN